MSANAATLRVAAELICSPLLEAIAAQAAAADRTRSVDADVIVAIKASDLMRLTASSNLGGRGAPVAAVARELEAVAGACASTAWCLWNHLSVFHFYCGLLGPDHKDLLAAITTSGEWVSLPAGAGTSIQGSSDGDEVTITGDAHFGSGARYGEWVGITFMLDDDRFPLHEGEKPQMRSIRFRTLGCYPLTAAIESTASTLAEVILEMRSTHSSERSGRLIDSDQSASMEKKKKEGYF